MTMIIGNNRRMDMIRISHCIGEHADKEDCTHIIANCLKRLYEKDGTFESFRKLVGKKRKDWSLSKSKSRHMPPCMRGRMRFANLFPCVDWAVGCLSEWDALDAEVRQELAFLQEHRDFIGTLSG
jgi:hypothetical protein